MKIKRLTPLLLAALLSLELLSPAALAARSGSDTITVSSAEELVALSAACTDDDYCDGVTVVLGADIDLTGSGFKPIAVFGGTLEGGGHTVSGLSLSSSSDVGFIRTLEPGGLVRELTISGSVTGSGDAAGLLCGVCAGTLEGCAADGKVSSGGSAGGLAGVLTEGGEIISCENQADVTGVNGTGGIAGVSSGSIGGCVNSGAINAGGADASQNTGGIVGSSAGSVKDCENTGSVGRTGCGCNVGGIAGCAKGSVFGCVSTGSVTGKKDVGGIVGQLLPNVSFAANSESLSAAEELGAACTLSANALLTGMKELAHACGLTAADVETPEQLGAGGLAGVAADVDLSVAALEAVCQLAISAADEASGSLSSARLGVSGAEGLRQDYLALCDSLLSGLEDCRDDAYGLVTAAADGAYLTRRALSQLEGGDGTGLEPAFNSLMAAMEDAQSLCARVIRDYKTAQSAASLAQRLRAYASDMESELADMRSQRDAAISARDKALTALEQAAAEAEQDGEQTEARAPLANPAEDVELTVELPSGESEPVEEDDPDNNVEDNAEDTGGGAAYSSGLATGASAIEQCLFSGKVTASSCAGGIVGAVGFQLSDDPESIEEFPEAGGAARSLGGDTAVTACVFTGTASASDYAGGISGLSHRGCIDSCLGAGEVSASCAGGISGASEGFVSDCLAVCQVSGKTIAGGIAGQGADISCCLAAVRLDCTKESAGAVAGEAGGTLDGNIFLISDGLTGVAGVNYAGRAYGAEAGELLSGALLPGEAWSGETERLPAPTALKEAGGSCKGLIREAAEEFTKFVFSVSFTADGAGVAAYTVNRGDGLPETPQIPAKAGYYAEWSKSAAGGVYQDMDIEAVYTQAVSTVDSGGSEPDVILEGSFHPDAVLTVTSAPARLSGQYAAWSAKGQSVSVGGGESFTVSGIRVKAGKNVCATKLGLIGSDGSISVVSATSDRGYISAAGSDIAGYALLTEPEEDEGLPLWLILTAAGVLAVIIAIAVALGIRAHNRELRRRERERQKALERAEERARERAEAAARLRQPSDKK